jgi:hypothetical protein
MDLYADVIEEMFELSGDMKSAAMMNKLDVQMDRLTGLIQSLLDTISVPDTKLQLNKTKS